MELTLLAYALGWIVLGLVAFTTVVPVGAKHPFMAMANIDSVIPFGLLGLLFVMAYPEDRRVVALLCIVTAAASESLALVLPGRHLRSSGDLQLPRQRPACQAVTPGQSRPAFEQSLG